MTIFAIDFARLYQDHMAAAGKPKTREEWDERAAKMKQGQDEGTYTTALMERLDFSDCESLLDVGCGAGAVALAAAPHLDRVYGLDFSPGMLALLAENARSKGYSNIYPITRAWEDDWSDVPVCDIVVASRSSAVTDMADALAKLNNKACRRVYLTSLVGGYFIDPGILAAAKRQRMPLPDYLYIVNILYRMGIHPRLDYIESGNRLAGKKDFTQFSRKVADILGELSPQEKERLKAWYEADPARALSGGDPFRWAVVSWEKSI